MYESPALPLLLSKRTWLLSSTKTFSCRFQHYFGTNQHLKRICWIAIWLKCDERKSLAATLTNSKVAGPAAFNIIQPKFERPSTSYLTSLLPFEHLRLRQLKGSRLLFWASEILSLVFSKVPQGHLQHPFSSLHDPFPCTLQQQHL